MKPSVIDSRATGEQTRADREGALPRGISSVGFNPDVLSANKRRVALLWLQFACDLGLDPLK